MNFFIWFLLFIGIPLYSQQHHKVIIIGSGPAGLSAAIYLGNLHYRPLVLTGSEVGGYLMNQPEVKNYPGLPKVSGDQLMNALLKHAEKAGCTLQYETVESIDFKKQPFSITTHSNESKTDNHSYTADVVIIAAGLHPRKMNIPGEEQYWQHGVGICALCDVCYDQETIIIGNGHLALHNALYAGRNTKKITIIFEENELTGPKYIREAVENLKPKLLPNTSVTAIKGDGEHVTHVIIKNKDYPQGKELPAHCVLISLGLFANTDIFKDLRRDHHGFIQVDEVGHTSIPMVFAAGSITPLKFNQAIICSAHGSTVALEAEKALETLDQKKSNPPSLYQALIFKPKFPRATTAIAQE